MIEQPQLEQDSAAPDVVPETEAALAVPEAITSADLTQVDPIAMLEQGQSIVKWMAAKCTGPEFIADIQGRRYPKVEWWTTVGMALQLFPVEVESKRFNFEGGYQYEAIVEVRRNGNLITRASAICSTDEKAWGNRDEYAVKSMATTRACGKSYRLGLSSLAVMAGLEPTPADEIPPGGFPSGGFPDRGQQSTAPDQGFGTCPEHQVAWFQKGRMRSPAHPVKGSSAWCNRPMGMADASQTGSGGAVRASSQGAGPSRVEVEDAPQRLPGGEIPEGPPAQDWDALSDAAR
jgi:hypothetical protein